MQPHAGPAHARGVFESHLAPLLKRLLDLSRAPGTEVFKDSAIEACALECLSLDDAYAPAAWAPQFCARHLPQVGAWQLLSGAVLPCLASQLSG